MGHPRKWVHCHIIMSMNPHAMADGKHTHHWFVRQPCGILSNLELVTVSVSSLMTKNNETFRPTNTFLITFRLSVLEALGRAVLPGDLPNEPDPEEEESQKLSLPPAFQPSLTWKRRHSHTSLGDEKNDSELNVIENDTYALADLANIWEGRGPSFRSRMQRWYNRRMIWQRVRFLRGSLSMWGPL